MKEASTVKRAIMKNWEPHVSLLKTSPSPAYLLLAPQTIPPTILPPPPLLRHSVKKFLPGQLQQTQVTQAAPEAFNYRPIILPLALKCQPPQWLRIMTQSLP